MPDVVKLLPDHIANQIAAGEVIQRPASAVKELLENSIDAGSSSIKLFIKDSGKSLIQVNDNGSGMSSMDARMCFEKHATSKIKNIDDLYVIRSMGFRGEALASIAAIAQVEMKTRLATEETGTLIRIEGSEVKEHKACACDQGSSIAVKNLFYNVPARRNFLKSNQHELKLIIEEFQRLALAHPQVFFSMYHNDYELFHLPPTNLRQRIIHIFGDKYNERLVPLNEESQHIHVYGFAGKPEFSKHTRGEQYFFVNQRFIKSPYLHHAVMQAYQELISREQFPFYIIFIDIDPKMIDINVHPTKNEIKFEDDRLLYSFVNAGIKHGLGQYSVSPTIDFESQEQSRTIEHFVQAFSGSTATNNDTSQSAEREQGGFQAYPPYQKDKNIGNWEEIYRLHQKEGQTTFTIPSENKKGLFEEQTDEDDALRKPVQLHFRYILSPIKSGFILLDQQAAHERILYERYKRAIEQNKAASQRQLFPQTLELNASDSALMHSILDDINKLGFDIQEFGKNSFVIHSVPADMLAIDEKSLIEELLESFKHASLISKIDKRDQLARSLAYSTGAKYGKALSEREMNLLIDELFACENAFISPRGRLTFLTFDLDTLDKKFMQQNS